MLNNYILEIKINAPIISVTQACLEAIKDCNYTLIYMTYSHIKCNTKMSFVSWGEEIDIIFKQVEAITEVKIISKSIAQLIDWGKNKNNVMRIFYALNKHLNE